MEYQQEYVELLKRYRETEVDAEEIGFMIAKMAQYFAEFNMKLVSAQHDLAIVAQDIENRSDSNGKAISSAKAQVFVDATDEASIYANLKAHVQNIEQYISALRALQRGMMNEYNAMTNT